MKNGQCPKCGSTDIYMGTDNVIGDSSPQFIRTGAELFPLEVYLCGNCRNVELYAASTSTGVFGKGKPFSTEILVKNHKWQKV